MRRSSGPRLATISRPGLRWRPVKPSASALPRSGPSCRSSLAQPAGSPLSYRRVHKRLGLVVAAESRPSQRHQVRGSLADARPWRRLPCPLLPLCQASPTMWRRCVGRCLMAHSCWAMLESESCLAGGLESRCALPQPSMARQEGSVLMLRWRQLQQKHAQSMASSPQLRWRLTKSLVVQMQRSRRHSPLRLAICDSLQNP